MVCPHCGTSVRRAASECATCGADLRASNVVDKRSWLQRFHDSPTPPRALLAIIPCAFGVWEMVSSLFRNANMALMVQAAGAAALGGLLAGSVLIRKKYVFERAWPRFLAMGDAAVAAATLLAPVAWVLGRVAMIPATMASEPRALNNAHQLAAAIQSYTVDNDGRLPGWMTVDGRQYHNVWDEQIFRYVKDDAVYRSGADGNGLRSPSQPPPRRRVLDFALNGLLITKPKATFDGNADWAQGPASATETSMSNPSNTILLAEVATRRPMGGIYARPETPPASATGIRSREWRNALAQWVDADPRAWVETRGPLNSYHKRTWDADRGIGRELHAGGACYAFCDGHVEYVRVRGTVTGTQLGMEPAAYWSPSNTSNMWNPR